MQTNTARNMLRLFDVHDVYCDAHLADEAGLHFISLWGRDTAIQELLARLSVPRSEGGIRSLRIGEPGQEGACFVPLVEPERMIRTSARRTGTVFGELVHLWLYDCLAVEPDRANGRAMLLYQDGDEVKRSLWSLLVQTLWVPTLKHWESVLLPRFLELGYLTRISGHRVNGFLIDLSDRERVEQEISSLVRGGRLTLEADG